MGHPVRAPNPSLRGRKGIPAPFLSRYTERRSGTRCQTEQEAFWAGEFGHQYIARNTGQDLIAADTALFARILARMEPVRSAIEFGATIGLNLRALRHLCPRAEFAAVEINANAADALEQVGGVTVFRSSTLEFQPSRTYGLAFTRAC